MVQFEKIEELSEGLRGYLNTNIQLVKQETISVSSVILSDLISHVLIGLAGIFFLFFISLMAGFYLSELLESNLLGFAIVAGFYFLISLILFLIRKKWLSKPIRERIIRKAFEKK
ncbi:MAG: phage holin family protein [Bacteroidales bacterium]|nr:phage holin family protein [Bacteroidales bacterium]